MGELTHEEEQEMIAEAIVHGTPEDTPKPLSPEDGEQPEQEPEHVWDGTVRA